MESCWLITRTGSTVHLKPSLEEVPPAYPTVHTALSRQIQTRSTGRHKVGRRWQRLLASVPGGVGAWGFGVEPPFFAPLTSPDDIPPLTPLCTAQVGGQEVSVQYNLCNEPWLKYTLSAIADRGLKRSQWTSSRLLDEALMLETAG